MTLGKLHVEVHVWSVLRGLGRVAGQPIVVVNARTLPGVEVGTRALVKAEVSAGASIELGPVAFDVDSVMVQGTLSISDVRAEKGSTVLVRGTGFGSGSTVEIEGAVVSSANVLGPQEIAVTLGGATEVVGKRVRVRNADGAVTEFYACGVAGAPDRSNRRPIYPLNQLRYSTTHYIRLRSGTVFLHNATADAVEVEVVASHYVYEGRLVDVLKRTTTTLRPGETWSGVTSDLGAYDSSYLYVFASAPLFALQLMNVHNPFSPPGFYDYAAPLEEVRAPRLSFNNPAESVSWIWQTGTVLPEAKTVKLSVAAGTPKFDFQLEKSGGDWFTVDASSTGAYPDVVARANASALAPGIYRGTITLTPNASRIWADVSPLVIPVVLTVTASPLKTTVEYAIFTQPGGPLAQSGTVRPDIVAGAFKVSVLTGGESNWLMATPTSGTSPAVVTLTANPTGLAPGTHSGHVIIQGERGTQIIETLLFVYSGVWLRPDDFYLHFGSTGSRVVSITPYCRFSGCPATVPQSLPFTASVKTNSGGNWLSVTAASDSITVRTNAERLQPGTYTGWVIVRSPDVPGTLEMPVVLTISDGRAPALEASPAGVELSDVRGAASLQAGVCVSSDSTPTAFVARGVAKNGGDWLRLNVSQAVTPSCGLTVSADVTKLNAGVYTGEVVITAAGQSLSVPVTLRVAAQPPPLIGAIVNAASMRAGSVAPGELVTVFGSALSGAVLVDGASANVLYASATQVNAVIPERVRGRIAAKLDIWVASWTVPVTGAAPGVFGVLNENSALNSASDPAVGGSIIQIFGTGFNADNVTITIGGKPAEVLFAGQAPGAVAGLYQINAMLPARVDSGDAVPLLIQVGSASTTVPVAIKN